MAEKVIKYDKIGIFLKFISILSVTSVFIIICVSENVKWFCCQLEIIILDILYYLSFSSKTILYLPIRNWIRKGTEYLKSKM